MSDLTLVGKVKLESGNSTEQRILDYLNENASEVLVEKINAGKKTLSGAVKYATEQARKMASGSGCVCVDDATVFGWIVHFFEEDEIQEPKAEKPKAVVRTPAGVKKAKKAGKAGETPAVQKQDKPQGPIFLELFKADDVASTKPVEKS